MTTRLVEVDPPRLARWVDGFWARHGHGSVEASAERVVLTGADGAVADLEVPWPPLVPPLVPPSAESLAAHAARPRMALLVLVRRGGWGAGVASGGSLLASAHGTRYVQGRTAAGGWSQQRFARRRAGQTAVLAGAAADGVARVLEAGPAPEVVVPGGDRLLVEEVLADPRLRRVADLPRGPLLDVADPRRAVLETTARRALAVRVRVTDPAPPSSSPSPSP